MSFSERLSLLMALLGVSNSTLARALSVDASLVSRWRTGTRTPTKNSSYIEAIADYFAGQAKKDYQKAALCEIIGLPPEKRQENISLISKLLHAWLAGEAASAGELVEGFVGRLEAFRGAKGGLPSVAAGREAPSGKPHRAEVFYGIEGKRRGVIRFLSAVVAQNKPGVLLLYSDESIEWFTADRGFLAEFVSLFFDVIARGNRVKIVHVVSRDLSEMLAAIDFWLPFYMTGAIEPYYCPRHREHFFRRTMFIAPAIAALTCSTLAGLEDSAPNLFYSDPATIDTLTSEFNCFLGICRPLMRIFTSHNPSGLDVLEAEFEEQPGDCIRTSNRLSLATMPEELF
ncbi:MAG: helix-turn-helix transcriptional regulator, partial [Syntrophomonadaceae bacterium]|nr:helix-turn-helix transcriptional regulator [Syntrophomonadaceae bacterium]